MNADAYFASIACIQRSHHSVKGSSCNQPWTGLLRRSQGLSAISNLGDARQLELVLPYLTSSDESVRRSAFVALRHMKSEQVDPILAVALGREKGRNTLLALLGALRLRGSLPVHRQALAALLARPDLDEQARRRALTLSESWNENQAENTL